MNEILTILGEIKMTEWVAVIALIVSIISLLSSFFHPEIRRWCKKKFFPRKLDFIAVDNLILFFNQAGAYIRLNITVQPPNDAITIKNIATSITNKKTNENRIFNWSSSMPLVVQNVGPMQVNTFAEAAPERILQDDIRTFKLEFSDTDSERVKNLARWKNSNLEFLKTFDMTKDFKDLETQLKSSSQFASWQSELSEIFFWKKTSFSLEVIITDSKEQQYKQKIYFSISDEEYKMFRKNVDEFFVCEIKQAKNIPLYFFTSCKNFANGTLLNEDKK